MPKSILIFCCFIMPFLASAQTADFSYQSSDGLFCNPTTIQFTQACSGNPIGFYWDFGNNTQGYTSDIAVTYTNPGTYTVKLIAIYDKTIAEVSKTVVIHSLGTPAILADQNYICKTGAINFTAQAAGTITKYEWNFGDSADTLSLIAANTTHDYTDFGTYNVFMRATDTNGCVGISNTQIKVVKPPITAKVTPPQGCIPANVVFKASVNVPVTDYVKEYSWDFGDGTPITSTKDSSATHVYNIVGKYPATLSITTNEGCANTINFSTLAFGTPPTDHVAYPKKTVVCGSETPEFVSKANDATYYGWNFGDGSPSVVVLDTVVRHKYDTLGDITSRTIPYFNGCPGKITYMTVQVIGVIAKFDYSNTCSNRKTYTFKNTSRGNPSSYVWNFGDNSPNEFTRDVIHTFPDNGQFITSLTITDSVTGCSDTYYQTIYTANPNFINTDISICRYSNTTFSIENSYTDSSATYTWNVLDTIIGPAPGSAITVYADSLGIYNNFVTVQYGTNSCPDTIRLDHSITVKGPNLSFDLPASLCFNVPVNIVNHSKPFVESDSVVLWYWNYGNILANDPVYQPASFQYVNPGIFNVQLNAVDIHGCKDSLAKKIAISTVPFVRAVPRADTLCIGQSANLIAFSSDSILWAPGRNISCATCDTIVANPGITTLYYVTATTPYNCSVTDSVLVSVHPRFTASAESQYLPICPGDKAQLDVAPKNNMISWSPSAGLNNSTSFTPLASPSHTTTYTAILKDSVGCYGDSISITVAVKSSPTVHAGVDQVVPYNAHFTISPVYSSNVAKYTWTPSLLLSCSDCAVPGGVASYSENYTIKVTSDSGCVAADSINIFVECNSANIFMPGAFTPNNDNLNDYYYPITRGIKTILKFVIFNREGKIVFQAQNFTPNSKSFAWDGRYKGANQPQGGYVYILEAACELGEKLSKSGSFMLLR